MQLEEYLAFPGMAALVDLFYLPKPNTADVVLTSRLAPTYIMPTAFCFPFLRDGRVVLANNRRRGAEIPGGHRDPWNDTLEDPEDTARREALEETGAQVFDIRPIGFMRSHCTGDMPEGYRYPFPHSCQQFFAGYCEEPTDYVENDECLAPLIVAKANIEEHLKDRGLALYYEAHYRLFGL